MHRSTRTVAAGAQVSQQHLPWGKPLVEQFPEGLIGRFAEALDQGFSQIKPGRFGELQLGVQFGAAMLKPLQSPGGDRPPGVYKRLASASLSQQLGPYADSGISTRLAKGHEQGPPIRIQRDGRIRRIQGPGSASRIQSIPGEPLVEIGRLIGGHHLTPVLKWQVGLSVVCCRHRHFQPLMQTPALAEQLLVERYIPLITNRVLHGADLPMIGR